MINRELNGSLVPLVTPFNAEGEVDFEALRSLVDFVLNEGADGLVLTALTGEGPMLSSEETGTVWKAVFRQCGDTLPIVPCVISTTTRHAIALVREAEQRGASAVMVAPILPDLYSGRSWDDVVCFFQEVTASTTLPLVLFNYPSLTGVDLKPALVAHLSQISTIAYIKESTGDSQRVHSILRRTEGKIRVICGAPNNALESFALGCEAWITGIMNVLPRSARQLILAVQQQKLPLARRIYFRQILPLVDILMETSNPIGVIKTGLSLRGVPVGAPRRPGRLLTEEQQDKLQCSVSQTLKLEAETDRALHGGNGSS